MRIIYIFIAVFVVISSIYSENSQAICNHCSGFTVYGKQSIAQIQSTQNVRLIETEVYNSLNVVGHLYSEKAIIQKMNVRGQASLIETHIKQPSFVEGSFAAVDSKFDQSLIVSAPKMVFNNCILNNLIVKHSQSISPMIELKNNTQVKGAIIFESGEGQVYLGHNCIIHGTIQNGRLISKNSHTTRKMKNWQSGLSRPE